MANQLSPRRVGKIGSSMVAGLFNVSPYTTRTGLYAHFVQGYDIDTKPDERMGWGKRLQSVILAAAAEELNLEVAENVGDDWREHPDPTLRCGATIDGDVHDPALGDGIVEGKNVDWLRWRDTWQPDAAPPHIELQLQHQLWVTGAPWGVIAVLVGGNELRLIKRHAMPAIHAAIEAEIRSFWRQVETKTPPDVMGMPLEIPELAALYPEVVPEPILELFDDIAAADFIEAVREYEAGATNAKTWDDIKERAKAKILGTMRSHAVARTNGFRVDLSKSQTEASVVELPPAAKVLLADVARVLAADEKHVAAEVLGGIASWQAVTRKASTRQTIKIRPVLGDPPAPDRIALAATASADRQFGG